jgi:hypothetical protein
MIIPTTLHNGILITIGGIVISTPFLVWSYVLFVRQVKSQKASTLEQTEKRGKDNHLPNILISMHERMMYLKTVRAKQRFNKKQFEKATPILLDKLGLVKLGEWDDFKKKWSKKLRRLVPKSPEKRKDYRWHYKVIGKGTEIRDDLVGSKKWQIEDAVKVGEWLDSLHIGLGELRDNDEKWQSLFKMTEPFRNDSILRKLIHKHISSSYAFCSSSLCISYGNRLPKNNFSQLLYAELVDSNISPHDIEITLNEILEEIISNETKSKINNHQLEKGKIIIEVKPNSGHRSDKWEHEHLMWAELTVTNLSSSLLIKDVEVRIIDFLNLQEKQDRKNEYVLFRLHKWNPILTYWSERNAPPSQLNLDIPANAKRISLIAYSDNSNGPPAIFNTPTSAKPLLFTGGHKIDIEVSSSNSVIWNGEFYIECHPKYVTKEFPYYTNATIEFETWEEWLNKHEIINLSVPGI